MDVRQSFGSLLGHRSNAHSRKRLGNHLRSGTRTAGIRRQDLAEAAGALDADEQADHMAGDIGEPAAIGEMAGGISALCCFSVPAGFF